MNLAFNFADCINSLLFGQVCDTCNGSAIYSLLAASIGILTAGVGILAVIGILFFGVKYLKSGGDPTKAKKARSRLVGVGIGVGIYIVAFSLVNFLLPGGIIGHPIASTDETASCPQTTYSDIKIIRPNLAKSSDISSSTKVTAKKTPTPYADTKPTYKAEKGYYNGKQYNCLTITNATPYIYFPENRTTFTKDLKNIEDEVEGKNILIIANAGTFDNSPGAYHAPIGKVIQDGKVVSDKDFADSTYYRSMLVIDEDGKIGYTSDATYSAQDYADGKARYTDALTGLTVTGKKIISASTNFGPIVINGQATGNEFKANSHYDNYRERQIFCLKDEKTYKIISNNLDRENGGWNYYQMANVAIAQGCKFAYNFDGGGSTSTAWRNARSESFANENIYRATNIIAPSFLVFTDNNLPPGKSIDDYASLPVITPTDLGDPVEVFEKETIKINMYKKDERYFSYVWVQNANKQLKKQYTENNLYPWQTLDLANLTSDKVAIGFNMSDPCNGWWSPYSNYNKDYWNTEPSPFIIKEGETIIAPKDGYTNKDGREHSISWIDGNNQLRYSKPLDTMWDSEKGNMSYQNLYEDVLSSGGRNTIFHQVTLLINGEKTDVDEWGDQESLSNSNTYGNVLCQLDQNNFIVITSLLSTRTYKDTQNTAYDRGCKTAVNSDGGGSSFLVIKRPNESSKRLFSVISTETNDYNKRGAAVFYFTDLDQ